MTPTEITIRGDEFLINGRPTYEGRFHRGMKIEGLLMNSRMVQATFDDLNPETSGHWRYPDTGRWDPERQTDEFIEALPLYRKHGLLSFTLNVQGGSPRGYSQEQPWHNSGWDSVGRLRPAYEKRLERVIRRAADLGMAPILGYFYFGQDQRLKDEAAVLRATDFMTDWLLERDFRHVLVEVNNECDVRYDHEILQPRRVHELIDRVKRRTRNGRRLLVGTSYGGGSIPGGAVCKTSDFLLIHGNGVSDPRRIAEMVRQCRSLPEYRPMPILFNEDDHFDFEKPVNNMMAAMGEYASWGYFDPGENNYRDGYQCPPTQWGINTDRKKRFFETLARVTGSIIDS